MRWQTEPVSFASLLLDTLAAMTQKYTAIREKLLKLVHVLSLPCIAPHTSSFTFQALRTNMQVRNVNNS